jgi:glycosyltransferase involved in cell wall biosynthesis
MVAVERIAAEQIVVLPTAYIPSAVSSRLDIRAELGLPPESLIVGTAAILRVEKALNVMIEAHARVVREFTDAHLVIAGEGDCRAELERQVAELGIGNRVHFLGHRPDVDSILSTIDVGALSSDWEGMPLFVFECMAAGTALVATAVGGVPEIVEHGRTGLLVPPRDPAALAAALTELLVDPRRRAQLADAASERINEFTIESVAGRFVDLYEELVAGAANSGQTQSSAIAV